MTNEELKKKIMDVINATDISVELRRDDINILADALIAAGIGDVKEAEHRAEVAERALRNAAPRLNCHGGLGKGFCRVDKCDYYHCSNNEGCVKAHLQQAEKELAEEKKE